MEPGDGPREAKINGIRLTVKPAQGYCSRCNQVMPLYDRKVINRPCNWVEYHKVCGFCNWICVSDCRRIDG